MAEPLIKAVHYEPNIGPGSGIGVILRGDKMRAFMAEVGAHGVLIARPHTSHPDNIVTEHAMEFTRWTANVINLNTYALREEYGSGNSVAPRAPLGHVVNWFREHDPNRH